MTTCREMEAKKYTKHSQEAKSKSIGLAFRREPHSKLQRGELENFICAEFIGHDIVFLSELLRNASIDIACSFCTSHLEQLMAIRRELKKELSQMRNAERGMRKVKRKIF